MRFILTLLLLFSVSAPAHAQTAIGKNTANAYYLNCLKQDAPTLSEESKNMLCSCTAANMMRHMSVEDVQTMSSSTPQAREAVNKMLIYVYAPCMEFPAKDYYYKTCLSSPDTAKISSQQKPLCDCMSSEIAEFLSKNASGVFLDILDRQPDVVDPMTALTEDPEFKKFAESKLLGCYAQNR